jgi:hypothetical protein
MVSAVEALLAQDFPTFKAEPKMKPLDPRRLGISFYVKKQVN